ncbi:UDP-N-acetylmuramoyl-L-alanyl-D-glutamate--2,6-diaminopimelate ligase [soil metagenome]
MPNLDKLLAGLETDLSIASTSASDATKDKSANGISIEGIVIEGITTDPELCRKNFLYVAEESETVDSTRYGVRLDGRDYIERALANGATVVLSTPETKLPANSSATLLHHALPLSILGPICSAFYGEPKPKNIALITGTNGKTSTVNFCKMLWSASGLESCSVGNLGGVLTDGTLIWDRDPTLSVPETVTLHTMLNTLARRNINHVAFEATSHAIFDYRLHGVAANIGAFTNLTRDHLDFHLTMEEYFRVKMMLFNNILEPGSHAILNADAEWFAPALEICQARKHKIITYGRNADNGPANVRLVESKPQPLGQKLTLSIFGKAYQCKLNLFGEFQASNALCALSIVIASGVAVEEAVANLETLSEVEGRLNLVATSASGGKVIVDYAHSPDAIRAALEACRSFTPGKLTIVFGCNGERDLGKRKDMGEVAQALADSVIVTDGHPRSEEPANIRKDVLVGAPKAREIAGRVEAITEAISSLTSGDTVLIAGLGHENFQSIDGKNVPYSDRETAQKIALGLSSKA